MAAFGLVLIAGGALMIYAGLTGQPMLDNLRSIINTGHGIAPNVPGTGQETGTATGGTKAL